MAGESLSDLGFTPERIAELQGYAQGLQTGGTVSDYSQDYGFAAETENNFRELNDPTSSGSLQADMRKIGQSLGYEHSGTLNPSKVKDFILGGQGEPEPEKPILAPGEKFSPQLSSAILETEKYEMELPYYGTKLFNDRNSEVYGYDKVDVPQYDYTTDSLYAGRIDPKAAQVFAKKYKLDLSGRNNINQIG